jgi:mannitol/fructose-specific phosphotransferase system IIA component
VLGIASQGDGHVELLGNLAELIQEEDKLAILQNSQSAAEIAELLLGTGE